MAAETQIKFNPEINLGQIIAGISLIVTFGTMLWWQSSFQTSTSEKFNAITEKFTVGDAVRAKYVPMIETVFNAQSVTNDRLQNVSVSLREIRDELREVSQKMSALEARIIKLEVTVANNNTKTIGMISK